MIKVLTFFFVGFGLLVAYSFSIRAEQRELRQRQRGWRIKGYRSPRATYEEFHHEVWRSVAVEFRDTGHHQQEITLTPELSAVNPALCATREEIAARVSAYHDGVDDDREF